LKRLANPLEGIRGWVIFAFVAILLFNYLLAVIIDRDWLKQAVLITLLGGILVTAVGLYLFWVIRKQGIWRALRRESLTLVGFIVLAAVFYIEEDIRGWLAWHRFKHAQEAKGERFDFASIVPPEVPEDQNFALTLIVTSSYNSILDKNGNKLAIPNTNTVNRMEISQGGDYRLVEWPTNGNWIKGAATDLHAWQNYYHLLATKTKLFPIALRPQSPAADVLLALSKYDSTIEEIRKASTLPDSRFPLDYNANRPDGIPLPHLSSLRTCCQVLQLRAIAELENGQDEKACHDVKLMLRLIDSTHTEPFLITHLVRNWMAQNTLQVIWEGLIRHRWSDVQLAELSQELSGLNFLKDYELAMRGERAGALAEIESLRQHRDYQEIEGIFGVQFGFIPEHPPITINPVFIYLMPSGWYYQNELAVSQYHQKWLLPVVDIDRQLAFPEIINDSYRESQLPMPWNGFVDRVKGSLRAYAEKTAYTQSYVNMARVACQLERYHLAYNKYPETLDAIETSAFSKAVPHDIIGGQSLHYRLTNDGSYVLYSIGWNETDDGGKLGLRDNGWLDARTGDWAWPSKSSN
jgi:hypothetical protein